MKRLAVVFHQIGSTGVAAIVLLAAAVLFSNLVVAPMQSQNVVLQDKVSRKAHASVQPGADKVAAVYEFLKKPEEVTDWLAKLHGIGAATGVQLKSANYSVHKTEGRIVRYEIVLPASGSYGQIRDFLKRSLVEIPVMSVDQMNLKRAERSNALHAEMRLTLHMVKS